MEEDHGSIRPAVGGGCACGRAGPGPDRNRPDVSAARDRSSDTGPLQTSPQKTKPRQTALKKRAKPPAPEGRQITVHPRPSYLTAGTRVPVGSVGNGYVYDTFNQATPIQGTFSGLHGRERIEDQFGNPGPGLTLFRF